MRDDILFHWNNQADKFTSSHDVSWGDSYAIELEIKTIGDYIKEKDVVLDVGCANGHASIRHLHKNIYLFGVDFSENMIREANKNLMNHIYSGSASFMLGDIRQLDFKDSYFDMVYTTRTIINLPTWEEQKRGILECVRVCKKGGTIIFSEAFYEPLVLLNSIRSLKMLPPLDEPDFNRYLKKHRLEEFLIENSLHYKCIDFSSLYYLGSRFLREIINETNNGFINEFNEAFYQLEMQYSGGGVGIQQAYVITKE